MATAGLPRWTNKTHTHTQTRLAIWPPGERLIDGFQSFGRAIGDSYAKHMSGVKVDSSPAGRQCVSNSPLLRLLTSFWPSRADTRRRAAFINAIRRFIILVIGPPSRWIASAARITDEWCDGCAKQLLCVPINCMTRRIIWSSLYIGSYQPCRTKIQL